MACSEFLILFTALGLALEAFGVEVSYEGRKDLTFLIKSINLVIFIYILKNHILGDFSKNFKLRQADKKELQKEIFPHISHCFVGA